MIGAQSSSLGIETTTPGPKYLKSGTWSVNSRPSMTCAGASAWVVQCITVVIFCDSTPDLAW